MQGWRVMLMASQPLVSSDAAAAACWVLVLLLQGVLRLRQAGEEHRAGACR